MSVKHSPPPDYKSIERLEWKKAHEDVTQEAESRTGRLIKRVRGFMWRFGYRENDVLQKIRTDSMFAAWFAKEPRRTGLHEVAAAGWIETLPWVSDFEVLQKSGKNALKVSSDGNIESETNRRKLPGKSLDFRWRTGGKTFYAMHKYTQEGGGNQDSQYKEMAELMKCFLQCQNRDVVLLIIVDGAYYEERDRQRITELRKNQRETPPKSYVFPLGEIPELLEQYTGGSHE